MAEQELRRHMERPQGLIPGPRHQRPASITDCAATSPPTTPIAALLAQSTGRGLSVSRVRRDTCLPQHEDGHDRQFHDEPEEMARRGRPGQPERQESRKAAGEDDRSRGAEERRPRLDRRNGRIEEKPDGQEDARQKPEMAVEIGRPWTLGMQKTRAEKNSGEPGQRRDQVQGCATVTWSARREVIARRFLRRALPLELAARAKADEIGRQDRGEAGRLDAEAGERALLGDGRFRHDIVGAELAKLVRRQQLAGQELQHRGERSTRPARAPARAAACGRSPSASAPCIRGRS